MSHFITLTYGLSHACKLRARDQVTFIGAQLIRRPTTATGPNSG